MGRGRAVRSRDPGILTPRAASLPPPLLPQQPASQLVEVRAWAGPLIAGGLIGASAPSKGSVRGCQTPQLLLALTLPYPEGCPPRPVIHGLGTAGMGRSDQARLGAKTAGSPDKQGSSQRGQQAGEGNGKAGGLLKVWSRHL